MPTVTTILFLSINSRRDSFKSAAQQFIQTDAALRRGLIQALGVTGQACASLSEVHQ